VLDRWWGTPGSSLRWKVAAVGAWNPWFDQLPYVLLAALALAGGAAARRGETDAALQQYGVALQSFTLGRDRNLDLTYFYQRAKELDAVRALALAILSAGLDNADGHAFLLQESREIEGGSERTLRLAAQVALDASHRLADRLRRPSLINDTTGAADA